METFAKLFGSLLAFVYHCFDRLVIQGYLPLLCRPEHTCTSTYLHLRWPEGEKVLETLPVLVPRC